jgi:hypothetical protein
MSDWTRVQGAQSTTASGTTTNSKSLGAVITSGNVLVGTMLLTSGSGLISIKDDKNNNYLPVPYADDGNNIVYGFYPDPDVGNGLLTNGPQTITVITTNSPAFFWLNMAEFSPPTGTIAISLDGSQTVASNFAGATLPNFQTLNNDVLLFSAMYTTGVATTGAGWNTDAGSGTQQCSQWKIQATASGSVSAAYATQTGSGFGVVFGIAPVARSHWVPIQASWQHNNVAGTSGSVSFNNSVGAGNCVFGMIAIDNLANLTSLTDDKGNNYLPNILAPNFNGRALFWLGPISNGPKTVTANLSVSSSLVDVAVAEFRPPPNTVSVSLEAYTQAQPSGTVSPQGTGNITTTVNGDLLISMGEPSSGGAEPANSFSVLAGSGSTWGLGYQVQGTASASTNVSWSFITPTAINEYLAAFQATISSNTIWRALMGVGL